MKKKTRGMGRVCRNLKFRIFWNKLRGLKGITVKVHSRMRPEDIKILREIVDGLPKNVRATYWPLALDRNFDGQEPRVYLLEYFYRKEIFDFLLILEWD